MKKTGLVPPKTIGIALIGILVVSGGVWGIVSFSTEPEVKSNLPEELSVASLREQAEKDRGSVFTTMRETADREDLNDNQRRQAQRNMRTAMRSMADERVDEYFAADQSEKNAILDRQIDEFAERMKGWEQRRKERQREREARGEENTDESRRNWMRRGRGAQTREQRKSRSEGRDPDKSARRSAYFSAVQKRMQERGIESPWSRGGSRRGGFHGG